MELKHSISTAAAKGNAVVLPEQEQDNSLVLSRQMLADAIEASAGWTHEAICAHMRRRGVPVDPPYLSKMLAGVKPIGLKHLKAMPPEIQARYLRLELEGFGLFVVEPVDEATADRYLAIALVSKSLRRLPAQTAGPIKVEVDRRAGDRRVSA